MNGTAFTILANAGTKTILPARTFFGPGEPGQENFMVVVKGGIKLVANFFFFVEQYNSARKWIEIFLA